ncbi:hypothetical protein [Paenibacillus sp. S150]|uniref:hypothetical protein n=1 Tax=Paenibacillus sp. S150 TaxID=2749826 RepID=UPI001C590C29|nr:hypothetical protein [Paenibacillus sp. S150]MBW4085812.1 hypothetical protein [Paenibacillus sp. S150]
MNIASFILYCIVASVCAGNHHYRVSGFVTWVVCGSIFRKFLQQQHRLINIFMALFLVYSAVMVSGIL